MTTEGGHLRGERSTGALLGVLCLGIALVIVSVTLAGKEWFWGDFLYNLGFSLGIVAALPPSQPAI